MESILRIITSDNAKDLIGTLSFVVFCLFTVSTMGQCYRDDETRRQERFVLCLENCPNGNAELTGTRCLCLETPSAWFSGV